MSGGPRIGSLCTGYGGLDTAVHEVFGGTLAWVSDPDPGASRILAHHHPAVPNLGDLTAVDWADVEPVDVVCGGYPCQPFSTAGKRKGTADERHIWPSIAHALRVLRPRYAVFENVAGHLRLGFDTVLADLARLGFDAEWCLVRASEIGAPHQRQRLFLLAWPADAQGAGLPREGVRERSAKRGGAAPDAADLGHERGRDARRGGHGPADHGHAPADAGSVRLRAWLQPEPRREDRDEEHGNNTGRRGPLAADADPGGRRTDEPRVRPGQPHADWGRFAPAIRRWEAVLGRRAPEATDARRRLSPAFVEWLMGLELGHVTDVPDLTRTQQLKALGNGVVPQQAEAALRALLARTDPTHACKEAPA